MNKKEYLENISNLSKNSNLSRKNIFFTRALLNNKQKNNNPKPSIYFYEAVVEEYIKNGNTFSMYDIEKIQASSYFIDEDDIERIANYFF